MLWSQFECRDEGLAMQWCSCNLFQPHGCVIVRDANRDISWECGVWVHSKDKKSEVLSLWDTLLWVCETQDFSG